MARNMTSDWRPCRKGQQKSNALRLDLCFATLAGRALELDLYMGTSGKWSTTTVNLVPYKYILLLSIPVSTPRLSPSTFPYCSSASV